MSQIEKLKERLKNRPKDFSWDELSTLLGKLGYNEHKKGKTGGSRRKFVGATGDIISLHKPHPGTILKAYQVNQIIDHLNEKGLL
ncbi:MAG: type II toxin-antitoxin system HicA family toxin [Bacteroidia bacterium]|nr:type II toxin-antitoxin system HicA family toxin [Bacteroidia bacterium]